MSKSSSLVRRPDPNTPPKLSRLQSSVLSDALRMGEATRNVMEASLVEYGSWILGHVFGDDAAAALDVKSQNPIWLSLIHRAGGPTLRVSRRMLYVAVEIAARDKWINDGVWRALEPGRQASYETCLLAWSRG